MVELLLLGLPPDYRLGLSTKYGKFQKIELVSSVKRCLEYIRLEAKILSGNTNDGS